MVQRYNFFPKKQAFYKVFVNIATILRLMKDSIISL